MTTYRNIVSSFALSQLVDGAPLQSLYLLFAGHPAQLFRAFAGQQQPVYSAFVESCVWVCCLAYNVCISVFVSILLLFYAQIDTAGIVDEWRKNLAMFVANPTPNSQLVIVQLGDLLLSRFGQVHPNICINSLIPISAQHVSKLLCTKVVFYLYLGFFCLAMHLVVCKSFVCSIFDHGCYIHCYLMISRNSGRSGALLLFGGRRIIGHCSFWTHGSCRCLPSTPATYLSDLGDGAAGVNISSSLTSVFAYICRFYHYFTFMFVL